MKHLFTLLAMITILSNVKGQNDIENSKDYPLLGRLPNFSIVKYVENEFDSHTYYYNNEDHIHEGRKYTIEYRHNMWQDANFQFPSRLQILRNYSNAIQKAGGEILFERYNSEHGFYTFKSNNHKKIWVQVKVASGQAYKLIIIEEEKMRQDLVIDAELIKNSLELDGKIAIYGIYFDKGQYVVKENSKQALVEITKFLKENPTINCWVVGHTDSDGSFQLNSELSLNRAKAIRDVLIKQYGIAQHRLFAEGVGPLAPVATNSTTEGKQLNRRVELVKK